MATVCKVSAYVFEVDITIHNSVKDESSHTIGLQRDIKIVSRPAYHAARRRKKNSRNMAAKVEPRKVP